MLLLECIVGMAARRRRRNYDPSGATCLHVFRSDMGPRQSVETFAQMMGDTPDSSGIGVRPTTPADTAEICDLLEHGFVRGGIAADGWRPLCTTHWLADKPRGFVVTDGGRIVGHVGTIYSQREINGKTGIVCNFSSSCIAPAYRGRGLGATLSAAASGD